MINFGSIIGSTIVSAQLERLIPKVALQPIGLESELIELSCWLHSIFGYTLGITGSIVAKLVPSIKLIVVKLEPITRFVEVLRLPGSSRSTRQTIIGFSC